MNDRYLLLDASLDEGARERRLRRLGIKSSNVDESCEADGRLLYRLKKSFRVPLPPETLADAETIRRICTIHRYIEEYRRLIDLERRAEMEAQLEEIRRMSGPERERAGRAILGLTGRSAGRYLELWLLRLSREQPIETEIGSGDLVLLSRGDPLKSDLQGTVMRMARNYLEIALTQHPPKWLRSRGVRVDLFVNDITFKRMEANLERMRHLSDPGIRRLRDIVLCLQRPGAALPIPGEPLPGLNEVQREAVERSLGTEDLYLIHGPPGTGKTTTAVELIRRHLARGERVLAAADSNVAVDNLLLRLAEDPGIGLLRLGHPARIAAGLDGYSLQAKVRAHPDYPRLQGLLDEAAAQVERRNRHSKPTPARMRGMSRERILRLAVEGRSQRGVDASTIASMAAWIREDEKVEALYSELRELERAIVREIIEGADVVCATNAMMGIDEMEGITFELAVIDEAAQQIEPSTLLPLLRAPRAVLAGDHRQLPPTVVSDLEILRRSLFERMMETGNVPETMLRIQYRMNETIMDFPNRLMYDGRLLADESVRDRRLPLEREPKSTILDPDLPVVFVDCGGEEPSERLSERSTSYENPREAEKILEWVEEAIGCGLRATEIGVITPYLSQVKRIRRLLEARGIDVEVKSVDGFQGREKELIFISFVRSNLARAVGFVSDARRLNVAMTRARSKLVMVGDRATLEPNAPFDRLFDWFGGRGDAKIFSENE
ncbi:IGHMBP2 family helicase [Nitratifractor sp.]